MTETKMVTTPQSSTIKSIAYNPNTHEMQIEFKNGGTYLYMDVTDEVFNTFINAPSKGKFFHANIKDIYKYSRTK